MLAEAVLYLATPCGLDARRLGYLSASVGQWSRATRCRSDWSAHERRCRDLVARVVEGLERRRTVMVLGSGLLRDVDLPFLAARFETVVLVDIVHPLAARFEAWKRRNLRLLTRDLAGAAGFLLRGEPLEADPLASLREEPALDLVISANVLSQLPIAAWNRLNDRGRDAAECDRVAAEIVNRHLAGLAAFPCPAVLLTDTVMEEVDRFGRVVDRLDLLYGAVLPLAEDAWDWPVAPFGQDGPDHALRHRARGYPDWRQWAAETGAGEH